MSITAVFAYNNLDSTSDLNLHFKALFSKGFISGGTLTAVPATANVTVSPFYAISADGMVIHSDSAATVNCTAGQKNYIVLRAIYNAPAAPTLSLECLSSANLSSDANVGNLVVVGTVNLASASIASSAVISYEERNITDVTRHKSFLGSYATSTALATAWPAITPCLQKINDFAFVAAGLDGGNPEFEYWDGTSWIPFATYQDLQTNFAEHVGTIVDLGGWQIHVTEDEKAALTGTAGTPGSNNRYVTESDTSLLLTGNEKDALSSTNVTPLGGGEPSATNPFVVNGVPVTVTRAVSQTLLTAVNYVNISRLAFGYDVYTGKLGLDRNNKSSAQYWFKILDAVGNGYIDTDGPLYITDVMDTNGTSSFNPSNTTDVNNRGYWSPAAVSTSLRLVFNRAVPAGTTIYVGFNALGSLSKLAPQEQYVMPSTGFHAGTEAYSRISTAVIDTLIVTTVLAGPGTETAPAYAFNGATNTGMFYAGDVTSGDYSTKYGVGISIDGATVLLVSRQEDTPVSFGTIASPLVIEQHVASRGHNPYTETRIFSYDHAAGDGSNFGTISFGRAGYANAYTELMRLDLNTIVCSVDVDARGSNMLADRFFASTAGTETAPAYSFGNVGSLVADTGFYYAGDIGTTNGFNTKSAIGVTVDGRTFVVFAQHDKPSPDHIGDLNEAPLIIENNYDYSGGATTRLNSHEVRFNLSLGLEVATESSAHISFGFSAYSYDYSASLDITDTEITANVPVYCLETLHSSRIYTDAGTETAPAYTFQATNSSDTGLFYSPGIQNDGADFVTSEGVGVSAGGATVLFITRSEKKPASLGTIGCPLVIEQHISGASAEMRLVALNTNNSDVVTDCSLVLGTADYSGGFKPSLTLDNGHTVVESDLLVRSTISGLGRISAATSVSTPYVATNYIAVNEGSSATQTGLSFSGSRSTGVFGTASIVSLSAAGTEVLRARNNEVDVLVSTLGVGGSSVAAPQVYLTNTATTRSDWRLGSSAQKGVSEYCLDVVGTDWTPVATTVLNIGYRAMSNGTLATVASIDATGKFTCKDLEVTGSIIADSLSVKPSVVYLDVTNIWTGTYSIDLSQYNSSLDLYVGSTYTTPELDTNSYWTISFTNTLPAGCYLRVFTRFGRYDTPHADAHRLQVTLFGVGTFECGLVKNSTKSFVIPQYSSMSFMFTQLSGTPIVVVDDSAAVATDVGCVHYISNTGKTITGTSNLDFGDGSKPNATLGITANQMLTSAIGAGLWEITLTCTVVWQHSYSNTINGRYSSIHVSVVTDDSTASVGEMTLSDVLASDGNGAVYGQFVSKPFLKSLTDTAVDYNPFRVLVNGIITTTSSAGAQASKTWYGSSPTLDHASDMGIELNNIQLRFQRVY